QYWADTIHDTYADLSKTEQGEAVLIVSAHSLPVIILQHGVPYPEQLAETARLISERTGITNVEIGWQSEGITTDPWIGPDVQDLTRDLYEQKGDRNFVYAPVGFVSDHLEVFYDNDYECKVVCDELDAGYFRPEMPNTDPLFINTLAKVVTDKLERDA